METVEDVMATIKDLQGLIVFINGQADLAAKAGKDQDEDSFGEVALALGDYITLLKRMKLKEAF